MRQRAIDNGPLDDLPGIGPRLIQQTVINGTLANPDIDGKYSIEFHTGK
jgi:hypothetical protein